MSNDEFSTNGRLLSATEIAALPPPAESEVTSAVALIDDTRWPGEWHTICWMVASGSAQRTIAAELNYTESRISVILSKPEVQAKIKQIRDEHWGGNLQKRFAAVAPKAMDFFTDVVSGAAPAKVSERLDASKWLLEKVTGKPKQEYEGDGAGSVLQLLQALDALRTLKPEARSEQERDVIEVASGAKPHGHSQSGGGATDNWMSDWVDNNIPGVAGEKTSGELPPEEGETK